MDLKWDDGFSIAVSIKDNTVTLSANSEGLLSLANHLMTLAQDPCHNSLEKNSAELIIEKINN